MQNTFLSSNFSRRCNGSLSFSYNDYTYRSNDRFCGHYFGHTSHSPTSSFVSCCACCANADLSIYKVPVTPVYLCGLRQSTLIKYTPCKRVILNGLDRGVSRLPRWDVNKRSSFEKSFNFRERGVYRSRKGWAKGRYRCMVYEESDEEFGLDGSHEAEVMLSLLTEEVSDECLDVQRRNGRRLKKVIVDQRGYDAGADQCATCGSKKKVGSGILRNRLKFENELTVNKPRDEVDRTEERREEEKKALLRRGHQRVSARREDKDELLRGRRIKDERDESLRESRNKEREGILIENHKSGAKKEHSEDLLRREEHKQRLMKDGSSVSSYYSLSSMGEYESNSGIHGSQDEFEEGLTSKYRKNSRRLEDIEFDGKVERHGDYQDEQRLVLKKGKRVEGDNSNWQKEAEKKVTNMSTEEARVHKESDVHHDVSVKASYKKYEGQEEKTTMMKSNEGRREHRRLSSDEVVLKTETIKNYKQFKEHSEGYGANSTSSSDSQLLHSQREDISTTGSSSLNETRKKHYNKAGVITSAENYQNSSKHTQSSNSQKLDINKTSSSGTISGTTQSYQEKDSSSVLSSVHDAKEKHYHHGRLSTRIVSRKASQQFTEEVDVQRATISQRQSEHSIEKQEGSSSLVHGSYHESIKNIQTNEGVGKQESKTTLEKITTTSLGNDRDSGRDDADQRSRRKYDAVVTPPSSQRVPRGDIHAGSTSGLVIEEVGHDRSHEDETNGRSSEIQKEKQIHEKKTKHDPKQYGQQTVAKVVSGASLLKEKDSKSRHSSPSSGSKGPSVEMWDVDEPSNQEHPGAEVLDRNSAGSVITKRTGRSLWNVISDIVRFSFASRSTNQSQMSKSGGKSSPNQSTSSEAWFSGHEPDENIQEGNKNSKGSISQESISVKIPKEEKVRPRSQRESSSSSLLKDQIQLVEGKPLSYAEGPARGTSSGSNLPASGEGTSHQQSEVIVSGASMVAGSSQSPAIRQRRCPYIVGESSASGGGEIVQAELPVSTGASEISQPEGKDEHQKSRRLLRTTQVLKDRFEEWEEAYRIEAEQRKMDEMFMREALVEAKKAADSWEVPVGAVLVHDGKIIARGHNLVEELRDSTAHAEMICIREASKVLHTWRLSETTLYVTLEPCAMCAGAILQARIDVIVWGAPNKLLGADGSWIRLFPNGEGDNSTNPSDKAAAPVHPFHPNIQIRRNVLSSECADSMQQFFQRRRKKGKQQESPTPPSCLPIVNQPSKFLTKMHDAFHMMFCL